MDKRCYGLGLLFVMLPLTAHADRHKIGLRGAVTYAKRSALKGGLLSTEIPLARKVPKPDCCCCCTQPLPDCCGKQASPDCGQGESTPASAPREKRTLSAVLEGSIVTGEHEGEDLVQATYLSGLRYSFNHPGQDHVQIYLQGLVGGSHDSRGEVRDRPLAALGGGLHIPLTDSHVWAISLQVDRYALLGGSTEWYTEVSLGLVWRLEK